MKPSLKLPLDILTGLIAVGVFAGTSTSAQALTWLDGGTNTWNNAAGNLRWDGGTAPWTPGAAAVFNQAGGTLALPKIVTVGDSLNIGSLSFVAPVGFYEISSTGGHQIDFTGAGISNSTTNLQLVTSNGQINFTGAGTTAGNSFIEIGNGGFVNFLNTSTGGSATITNGGFLTFGANSSAGSATITNSPGSTLLFTGSANGTTGTTVLSGGTFDIADNPTLTGPGLPGTVTIGDFSNVAGGQAGSVFLGRKTLQVGDLTLGDGAGINGIDFTIANTGATGKITLGPGSQFTGSDTGETDIVISAYDSLDYGGSIPSKTFVLIDWAGSGISGVEIGDFNLISGVPGLNPASYLAIQNNQLILVAVPEPATLVMPLAGILGMVWLRRRASRMALQS